MATKLLVCSIWLWIIRFSYGFELADLNPFSFDALDQPTQNFSTAVKM